VLRPIAFWIQCDQPLQLLLAAHICFCFQSLGDEIGLSLKGIHAAAATLPQLAGFYSGLLVI